MIVNRKACRKVCFKSICRGMTFYETDECNRNRALTQFTFTKSLEINERAAILHTVNTTASCWYLKRG